jgi:hypothetical protein
MARTTIMMNMGNRRRTIKTKSIKGMKVVLVVAEDLKT